MIALRRETFDFGILPASFLVPRAESVASLAPIQRRLLQCAYPSRADPAQTVVTLTDAAQALGITHTNAAHVIDTMHAVAPSEPSTPNTNASQFFFTYVKCPHLNGKNTVFGKVIDGFTVLDMMEKTPGDEADRPLAEIRINRVTIHANPLA